MPHRRTVDASGLGSVAIGGDANQPITTNVTVVEASALPLEVARIDPARVYREVDVESFTGREWLVARIDEFLETHGSGYLWIEADAGLGKTAVAAWLVWKRGYLAHFSRLAPGGATTALQNIAAQLVEEFGLNAWAPNGLLPDWMSLPDRFPQLLELAVKHADGPVVLVIDGLDEIVESGRMSPLGLPDVLPHGVFVIGTHRTGFYPGIAGGGSTLVIDRLDQRNTDDVRRFLAASVIGREIAAVLAEGAVSADDVVDILAARCGGVWIYLRYVLDGIRTGQQHVDDLRSLPMTLWDFYFKQVHRWQAAPDWSRIGKRVLATLAAAGEAVDAVTLARLAGVHDDHAVRHWCDAILRPLLSATSGQRRQFTIYHASFRQFVTGDLPPPGGNGHADGRTNAAADLDEATRAAHARIADHYLDRFGGLHTGLAALGADLTLLDVDDGYPLRHLANHLASAARWPNLHALLTTSRTDHAGRQANLWFEAHDHADTTHYYLRDVALAWRDSERRTDNDLERGLPASGMIEELRYALISACVSTVTSGLTPQLVSGAVEAGLWSPERALRHVRRLVDPYDRVRMVVCVAHHLDICSRSELCAQILDDVDSIADERARAAALIMLAPHLDSDLHRRALDAATIIEEDCARTLALTALAAYADADQRSTLIADAVTTAVSIGDEYARAAALIMLATDVDTHQHQQLWTAATTMTIHDLRLQALTWLAVHRATDGWRDAVNTARAITDYCTRAATLIELAPYVDVSEQAAVFEQARLAALRVEDALCRADVLADLMSATKPFQQAELLGIAFATAIAIPEQRSRAVALVKLAPHLDATGRSQAINAVTDVAARVDVLTGLAAHASPYERNTLLDEALFTSRTSADHDARAMTFIGLATHLDAADRAAALGEASTAADAIADPGRRVRVLSKIAALEKAHAQETAVTRALSVARGITDVPDRVATLAELSDYLESAGKANVLADAVSTAFTIADGYRRTVALAELLAHLHEPDRTEVLDRALRTAARIDDDLARAAALTALAPHFSARGQLDALMIASDTDDERVNAVTLTGMAVHLTGHERSETLDRALAATMNIDDEHSRGAILVRLVPLLGSTQRWQALTIADRIGDNHARASVMIELATHLDGRRQHDIVSKTLTAVGAIANGYARTSLLIRLIPLLDADQLERALAVLPSAGNEVMATFIARARELSWPSRKLIDLVRGWLRQESRTGCLAVLAASAPIVRDHGGTSAVVGCVTMVQEVTSWWP